MTDRQLHRSASFMDVTTFFLHGFGSSPDEFRRQWGSKACSSRIFFLEGPELDHFTSRRRWFAFTGLPSALSHRVSRAADIAGQQILNTLHNLGFDNSAQIVLVGHSQGAMVSLELVRRRNLNVTSAWSYAGFLPCPHRSTISDTASSTKLYLFSSTIDQYIDPLTVKDTANFFRLLPAVEVYHYQTSHLPHAFSQEWMDSTKFEEVSF